MLAACSVAPTPSGTAPASSAATGQPSASTSASPGAVDPDPYALQRTAKDAFGPLPLEAYEPTTAEKYLLDSAVSALADECMAGFGFPAEGGHGTLEDAEISHREARNRLFGVIDVEQARLTGYLPAWVVVSGSHEKAGDLSEARDFVHTGAKPGDTPADQTASPGEVDGRAIPPNGCVGEARVQVYGSNTRAMHFILAADLSRSVWDRSVADATARATEQRWKECLAQAGFQKEDMWSWDDRFDHIPESQRPNDEERRMAVADATCNNEVGYSQTLYKIEVEGEKEAIEKNQLALNEERAALDQALARANDLTKER